MSNNPNETLTIFIPTFNRAQYLQQCLQSVVSEVLPYRIPIIISDNNSQDNTEQVVKHFQEHYPYIYYHKNTINTGLDRNELIAIELVKTDFFLWFGDDDLLRKGHIRRILERLETEQPSLLLVNAIDISGDLKTELGVNLNISTDFILNDCREFLAMYCYKMLYGALFINSKLARKVDGERFVGTNNAFAGLTLEFLAYEQLEHGSTKIIIESEPAVYLRKGEKTWHREAAELALLQVPEWFRQLHPFYTETVNVLLPQYIRCQTNVLNLLRHRTSKALSFKTFKTLLSPYPVFPTKCKAYLTLFVPSKLVEWLFVIKRKYIGRRLGRLIEKNVRLS